MRRQRLAAPAWALLLAVVGAGLASGQSSRDDPLTVVKNLYAAFDRGDMQAVLDSVSKDVTWVQYGPEYRLPFAGVFHGRSGVEYFFKQVDETLTDVHAGQREFIVSGDRVVVPGWEESTVRATGGHYRVDNVHVFTVQGGKIRHFEEFIDNAEVLEAFEPADLERGKALFTECAVCHGNRGEGRPAMHAPSFAGLGSRYLVQQLRMFRAGARGSVSDPYGYMMIGRSRALPGDRGVRDVAAYIDRVATGRAPTTIAGNVTKGKSLYRSCIACHGANAEGNPSLGAPRLNQQDDGYLRIQLEHYLSGTRGSNPANPPAVQMRDAATVLTDPDAIRDVVAYIESR